MDAPALSAPGPVHRCGFLQVPAGCGGRGPGAQAAVTAGWEGAQPRCPAARPARGGGLARRPGGRAKGRPESSAGEAPPPPGPSWAPPGGHLRRQAPTHPRPGPPRTAHRGSRGQLGARGSRRAGGARGALLCGESRARRSLAVFFGLSNFEPPPSAVDLFWGAALGALTLSDAVTTAGHSPRRRPDALLGRPVGVSEDTP